MNNITKDYKDEDGRDATIVANSTDNYEVNLAKNYSLANRTAPKSSKFADKFKNSILGADIGVKSGGFSTIAILATVIALAALAIIYFMWRF